MKRQHPDTETLSQLVEHLEILGIRPERFGTRAELQRLIHAWGVAAPGAGLHANGAREILARSGTNEGLLTEARTLLATRAAARAAERAARAATLTHAAPL